MRDTFADTSRARADLGFAPAYTLEAGLAAECEWLAGCSAVRSTLRTDDGLRLCRSCVRRRRWLLALVPVRRARRRAASGRNLPPPGQVDADKFLFDRGTEALQDKNWLDAREYFRRLVDTYPASAYRAGRQARHRRLVPRRGPGRLAHPRAPTSSASSCVLPARARAPTTRSTGWRSRSRKQMLSPSATRPPRTTRSRAADSSCEIYRTASTRRRSRSSTAQARDRLSEREFSVGHALLPDPLYTGRASPRLDRAAEERPELHAARRGLLLPGRVAAASCDLLPEALPYYEQLLDGVPEEQDASAEATRKRVATHRPSVKR